MSGRIARGLGPWLAAVWVGAVAATPVEMTAEQVVARNVAARGGLEAWRKVETMVWAGHIESARAEVPGVLFVLEQERPNKRHFQIRAAGLKMKRIFDGEHGWSERPPQTGGPPVVSPYPAGELTYERRSSGIDGPLIDYEAKGSTISLEGIKQIEGRPAFQLEVVLKSGEVDRVWVDTQSFLDVRYDRPSYGPAGSNSTASVYYREYKDFEGLKIPTIIETATAAGLTPDRTVIERVTLNVRLDESAFVEPGARRQVARNSRRQEPGRDPDAR
jgi:hypothetical protein